MAFCLTYPVLVDWMHRGFRNGNWRRLNRLERGYFRAATCYAKLKTKIVNGKVLRQLQAILEKLKATMSTRMMGVGVGKAAALLTAGEKGGVFEWCPQLKMWLQDRNYIYWLGLTELSTRYSFR